MGIACASLWRWGIKDSERETIRGFMKKLRRRKNANG
jgi:hypothetical protein